MNINEMKNIKFGIEIETGHNSRKGTAEVIANYFGTSAYYIGGTYSTWGAKDTHGREWKVMSDSSVHSMGFESCEIVSPLLSYDDIEDLQNIVRACKAAGNKADESCGIHIHIDNSSLNCHDILGLVNFVSSKEDIIYEAVQTRSDRMGWCQRIEKGFVTEMNNNRRTLDSKVTVNAGWNSAKKVENIKKIWYTKNGSGTNANNWDGHYDSSRYHLLNLHSMFQGKGIEFRCFNGTMHAGKIKAYIQFCLGITEYCKEARCISPKHTDYTDYRVTLNNWFEKVGMVGAEFSTMRYHLTGKVINNAQEVA